MSRFPPQPKILRMTRRTKHIAAVIAATCIALALLASALTGNQVQVDSGYRLAMGTFARIIAVAPNEAVAQKSIDAGFSRQKRVEELMSVYIPESELNRVNAKAHQHPVRVHPMTFEVIERAVEWSRKSNGAFDVTIGPLVELWRNAGDANQPPSAEQLAEARTRIGYDKLILDANQLTVQFTAPGMKLDLGGIAKGYAIDQSVKAMRSAGASAGMVDIGGDISCFGSPAEGRKHWRIGLQDPSRADLNMAESANLLVLQFATPSNDAIAVTTSGNYQRFTVIEGRRHSHIIDSESGQSSDALASVTIIAPDATAADALATAVSVLGAEEGLRLIENTPEAEGILISSSDVKRLIKSSGVGQYIKQ